MWVAKNTAIIPSMFAPGARGPMYLDTPTAVGQTSLLIDWLLIDACGTHAPSRGYRLSHLVCGVVCGPLYSKRDYCKLHVQYCRKIVSCHLRVICHIVIIICISILLFCVICLIRLTDLCVFASYILYYFYFSHLHLMAFVRHSLKVLLTYLLTYLLISNWTKSNFVTLRRFFKENDKRN